MLDVTLFFSTLPVNSGPRARQLPLASRHLREGSGIPIPLGTGCNAKWPRKVRLAVWVVTLTHYLEVFVRGSDNFRILKKCTLLSISFVWFIDAVRWFDYPHSDDVWECARTDIFLHAWDENEF